MFGFAKENSKCLYKLTIVRVVFQASASARKGDPQTHSSTAIPIEMDRPPEQAKDNARGTKLPAISYGHYEGQVLVTKHVDSVLILESTQTTIVGSTIYRTVDMSRSLLLDPDGYNAMLRYGNPRHSSKSSYMIAFREAAYQKVVT